MEKAAKVILRQGGHSLLEAIIASLIVGLVAVATATLMANLSREMTSLTETMEARDLKRVLAQSLGQPNVCEYLLKFPAPLSFNSTAASPSTPIELVPSVAVPVGVTKTGPSTFAPGPAVMTVGQPVSPMARNLVVSDARFRIFGGAGRTFKGEFVVSFTGGLRPVAPVRVGVTIVADVTTPSAATVVGCGSGSGSPAIVCTAVRPRSVPIDPSFPTSAPQMVGVSFTAAECGGVLPPLNYVGSLSKAEVCGFDGSWQMIQPGEAATIGGTVLNGPGITGWWLGACPSPGSDDSYQAVFVPQ